MKQAILKTICYFDQFDQPLTREELRTNLWGSESGNVDDFLSELFREGSVETKEGFYFLSGRSSLVDERRRRSVILGQKMRIAKRAAKLLKVVPFLKATFLCNQPTVGISEDSDIDTFIVTAENRIWTARFFTIALLGLFGLRIKGEHSKDKICLSFFATEKHLDLSQIRITAPDIYMTYWIAHLVPIYDPSGMQQRIMKQNTWREKFAANAEPHLSSHCWRVNEKQNTLQVIAEWFLKGRVGERIEKLLKKIQLKKIRGKNITLNDSQHRVVVSDTMLKFHENDRRAIIQQRWYDRTSKLIA